MGREKIIISSFVSSARKRKESENAEQKVKLVDIIENEEKLENGGNPESRSENNIEPKHREAKAVGGRGQILMKPRQSIL